MRWQRGYLGEWVSKMRGIRDRKKPTEVPVSVCEFGDVRHHVYQVNCVCQWWRACRTRKVAVIFGKDSPIG